MVALGAVGFGALATVAGARGTLVAIMVLLALSPVRLWYSPVGRVRRTGELRAVEVGSTEPEP